jgi:membrane associated rhomboid family serine protease
MIPLKDDNPSRRVPIATIILIILNITVFIYQFFYDTRGPAYLVNALGFTPYELLHLTDIGSRNPVPVPVTLLTAMFIHGGFLHIIGNMLFLWVFGDNVEDRLGHMRYLLFYVLCGLTASLIHGVIFSSSRIPTVGASGAIAGVLSAYMILFPRARVTTLVIVFFFIRIVRIPAAVLLFLWFILQIISGMADLSVHTGGVAWFAHIGGFAAGLMLLMVMRPAVRARRR